MKELINVAKNNSLGTNAVSARELYLGLGFMENKWSRWQIPNIKNNEFFLQGVDFIELPSEGSGNSTSDYAISIDFAKHIAMMARTTKSHEYRAYMIAVENNSGSRPLGKIELAQENLRLTIREVELETEVKELSITLDKEHNWSSIKRQEMIHSKKFNWRNLKHWHQVHGIEMKEVFDQNYGTVKSYSAEAWLEVYAIDISENQV